MIISTLWHSFPRFIQSQRLFWRRSKYLQHLCTLYGNIFHSRCNSHIIIVGILVHLKQWWRIQGAPEQRHRWRCSADSPKFPDYLQAFPSRTLPGSAMVTHAFQIWNETKQNKAETNPLQIFSLKLQQMPIHQVQYQLNFRYYMFGRLSLQKN